MNTYEADSGVDQSADALNVWDDRGELTRRPSFMPIGTAAPFLLPAGQVTVKSEVSGVFATLTDRVGTITASNIGLAAGRLWIGCQEAFDGIDWGIVTSTPAGSNFSANRRTRIRYRNTSLALVDAYGIVDTTTDRKTNGANTYRIPLMKNGRISWHRNQFTAWTATTLDGVSAFWVAVDMTADVVSPGETVTPVALATGGLLVFAAPGVRAFLLDRVNGLFPIYLRESTPELLIGSDRAPVRGLEPGANLGFLRQEREPTEQAFLATREAAGAGGSVTKPAWTHAGAGTGTEGTANAFTKNDQSYSWNVDEMAPAPVTSLLTVDGVSTPGFVAIASVGTSNRFQNLRIKFDGATTTVALRNQEREVRQSDSTGLYCYDVFPDTPVAGDTFVVYSRPAFARSIEGGRLYEIDSNTAHVANILPSGTRPYATTQSASDIGKYITFEIGREAPWALRAGEQWSACYDSAYRRWLLTNGHTGILEYDGRRLRKLAAIYDPTDGVTGAAMVQTWLGVAEDISLSQENPTTLPQELRRAPPDAKFLVEFRGHIVAANIHNYERSLQWTAPAPFTTIWPSTYEAIVRDPENGPITGMWTLGDQLVVSTPASLFVAPGFNVDGSLPLRPAVQGLGFVSGRSVAKVNIPSGVVLVGATADTLRAFDGVAMTEILDDWNRVVPGGVNRKLLNRAVAAYWRAESLYVIALPSSGSTVNDRVLLWRVGTDRFWLWSAPFGGVSAIASDVDTVGRERLLFGMQDGHICVLAGGDHDGLDAISWRAKSRYVGFGGETVSVAGLQLTFQEIGTSSSAVTVKSFLDSHLAARQTWVGAVDLGSANWGAGTWDTSTWAGDGYRTFRIPLRAGGTDSGGSLERGHVGEAFAFELSGSTKFRFRGGAAMVATKSMRGA